MPDIDDVVERVRELEDRRVTIGEYLRERSEEDIHADTVLEPAIRRDVQPADLDDVSIAGVDGGMIQKAFHGIDIILARGVAAIFSYEDGSVRSTGYLPGKNPRPDITYIESPMDRQEFNVSSSLLRLREELDIALEAVREGVDLLLLDGSIVPQYTDRPASDAEARDVYDDLVDTYATLFEEARKQDVLLGGVIEDSRGTGFCEILADQEFIVPDQRDVLQRSQDTNVLNYVLEQGERTPVMEYATEYEKHPTLNDIGDLGEEIYNFYMKSVQDGRPVRIDFLNNGDVSRTADRISSHILPLCGFSSTYGIPSVIVEADSRAKLSQRDLEVFESRLRSRVGPMSGVEGLRRDNRPF